MGICNSFKLIMAKIPQYSPVLIYFFYYSRKNAHVWSTCDLSVRDKDDPIE